LTEIGWILEKVTTQLNPVSQTAALDAQVLLAHVLDRPRSWVLAHPEASLDKYLAETLADLVHRRLLGEPLPYIIGHWEFFCLDFTLSPAVLIPRPETELLVERALGWLNARPDRRLVSDVGTGSACIAVSLAKNCPGIRVLASDISLAALRIARLNILRHGVSVQVQLLSCDLIPPIAGQFDLICANLPYIPTEKLSHLPVAEHEPILALDGGESGVDRIQKLFEKAPACLGPGGLMLLEIEASQGERVSVLARRAFPGAEIGVLQDLSGLDRLVSVQVS
jgi:release factor glutamine methyltransferase